MNRFATTLLVCCALIFLGQAPTALAQATGDQGAAPAATGPDTTTQVIENPPLSGLDEPSFEPGYGPRSYLLPSVQINQAVDTNATGATGSNTTIRDVTGFGSFGGAGAISGGASVPGVGGSTITQFGSVGNQPRITNSAIADITQALSPRASVVLSGGFGLTSFVNSPPGYINSQQASGQAGYNYQLSRHDQIAVTYGYQEFHFPRAGSGTFNVNVWQVMYGHRISGKLDLKLGGGPQWIHINGLVLNQSGALVQSSRSILSGSGHASLMYHMSARSNLTTTYSHYTSPGSGFFAGANTDAVRFALSHTLTRRWSSTLDTGYARNSRILVAPANLTNPTLPTNASTYQYWYAGAGLRRQLGRHFGAFTSYQYDSIRFNSGSCTTGTNCNMYGRHVGLIGLDWTPRPIRLD